MLQPSSQKPMSWKMKTSLSLGFALAVFGGALGVRAQLIVPETMSTKDAAQLDAALMHIREIQAAAKPYLDTLSSICAQYKINPGDLGRSVSVDFSTGKITRAVPAVTANKEGEKK